jgi:hypothetical protein
MYCKFWLAMFACVIVQWMGCGLVQSLFIITDTVIRRQFLLYSSWMTVARGLGTAPGVPTRLVRLQRHLRVVVERVSFWRYAS